MQREILDAFARFRRRHVWMRGWDVFLDAAFVMTVTSAALFLVDRLAFELGLASPRLSTREMIVTLGVGTLALAALVAAAAALLRPVSPARLAREIDRAGGGEERFLSALEVAAAGGGGVFAPALCRDALRIADAAAPSRVVPRPPVGHRWAILLSLGAAGVLYAVPAREYAAPIAGFEVSHVRGPAPLEVGFEDASIGAIREFRWTFGDGGEAEGEKVEHVYETPGRYRARLRVEGPGGASEKDVEIEVLAPDAAFADFSGEPRKGRDRVAVYFKNLSKNGKAFEWDFGDGAQSSDRDPVHVYEGPGQYTVKLRVTNELGEDSKVREKYVKVAHPLEPLADFRGMPREGEAPLEVVFEDLSTGALTDWTWDLGDLIAGEARISKERNPVYVYRVPGWYTVRLRVKGPHGEDDVEKVRYIHVKEEGQGKGPSKSKAPQPPKKTTPVAGGPKPPPDGPQPKFKDLPAELRHPDAPKDLVEKDVKVYTPPPPGSPGGPDAKSLESVLPEYRRAAEDSIERERIPPVLREHLRRYFDGLRPK
ncbi:MAG TPA: PKD domain-containing protein [Planctomycetota bacterium]